MSPVKTDYTLIIHTHTHTICSMGCGFCQSSREFGPLSVSSHQSDTGGQGRQRVEDKARRRRGKEEAVGRRGGAVCSGIRPTCLNTVMDYSTKRERRRFMRCASSSKKTPNVLYVSGMVTRWPLWMDARTRMSFKCTRACVLMRKWQNTDTKQILTRFRAF